MPEWYGDVAVMAVRIPDSDMNAWELGAKASSSGGDVPDLGILNDGSYGEWVTVLRDDALGCSWLQYEYPMPVTVRAFRLSIEAKREIMRGEPVSSGKSLPKRGTFMEAKCYQAKRRPSVRPSRRCVRV